MTLKHHDERERLLVKVHHAADADVMREDEDALKTTKTTTRSSWMKSSTLATIVSLLICEIIRVFLVFGDGPVGRRGTLLTRCRRRHLCSISRVVCARQHTSRERFFLTSFLSNFFRRSFFTNGSPAVFSRISLKGKKNETLSAIASHFITRASVVHERVYARNTAAQHRVFSKSESERARDDFKTSRRARTIARESSPRG